MLVVARRRGDGDVHATDLIDLVVLNLRENDLLLDAQAVVAAAVEGTGADAAEVPDARNRDAHETIEELVHAVAAQGHFAADRLPVADLERGDRLLRLGHRGLLSRDLGHVGGRSVHDLLVGHGLAHTHVDRDLEDARDLHGVLELKFCLELRHELVVINLFQSCCHVISLVSGSHLLRVDHFFVRLEHPHLAAVLERLEADAIAFLRRRIENQHVRYVQRRLTLDDAALHAHLRVRTLVLLGHIEPFDAHPIVRQHLEDRALAPLVPAGDQHHHVAFANLLHHSNSGASDMIFMNWTLRSSLVTGPKMRVPIGSSLLVRSTAALVSNRISDPSARRTPLFVRTTTASYTSPFFTLPRGIASLTLTLITSPTAA